MRILLTGGAGYIGSHMLRFLNNLNFDVEIIDDLSTGNLWAANGFKLHEFNLNEKEKLNNIFETNEYDSVIHFAAKSLVAESNSVPIDYYDNNISGTINLLDCMLKHNVNKLIFSSSAAVFGNPVAEKIDEFHSMNPINTYGLSKLICEQIIEDVCNKSSLKAISLRYFNAAGALKTGEIGEAHLQETHLIPNILKSVIHTDFNLNIFGDNFDTHDGTCVRDYVHVEDLANAHFLALKYLEEIKSYDAFNLGNGRGFSIYEIIKSCEKITNKKIPFSIKNKRQGDPPLLVADNTKANRILNWEPSYKTIDSIIRTAWQWHLNFEKIHNER